MLRADLLSVRSDLIVVVSGERFDRKYFTELTDVAVDVPTFELEVVGFFITLRIEVVTTFFNTDASELIRSGIAVNLSEAGEAFDSVVGCFEVVCFTEDAVGSELFEVDVVAEQEAVVAVAFITDCRSDDGRVECVCVEVDRVVGDFSHCFYLIFVVVDFVVGVVAAVVVDDVFILFTSIFLKRFCYGCYTFDSFRTNDYFQGLTTHGPTEPTQYIFY